VAAPQHQRQHDDDDDPYDSGTDVVDQVTDASPSFWRLFRHRRVLRAAGGLAVGRSEAQPRPSSRICFEGQYDDGSSVGRLRGFGRRWRWVGALVIRQSRKDDQHAESHDQTNADHALMIRLLHRQTKARFKLTHYPKHCRAADERSAHNPDVSTAWLSQSPAAPNYWSQTPVVLPTRNRCTVVTTRRVDQSVYEPPSPGSVTEMARAKMM
jgi:hypothetical protein